LTSRLAGLSVPAGLAPGLLAAPSYGIVPLVPLPWSVSVSLWVPLRLAEFFPPPRIGSSLYVGRPPFRFSRMLVDLRFVSRELDGLGRSTSRRRSFTCKLMKDEQPTEPPKHFKSLARPSMYYPRGCAKALPSNTFPYRLQWLVVHIFWESDEICYHFYRSARITEQPTDPPKHFHSLARPSVYYPRGCAKRLPSNTLPYQLQWLVVRNFWETDEIC
jgi:hypothetical protein